MKYRASILSIAVLLGSAAGLTHAASCDDPRSSAQIAQCLGQDLRESDAKINTAYKELAGKLSEEAKLTLRDAQRQWIKDRDANCNLNSKESDREKWYAYLLQDYAKTVCVTRYTRQRTAQLDQMLANLAAGTPDQAPVNAPLDPNAVRLRDKTSHNHGKWYFELTLNYADVVNIDPCAFSFGVSTSKNTFGILENVRSRDAGKRAVQYGIAVDLDNGKLYYSRNGYWVNGAPGSNEGLDLKLGRPYYAELETSADSVAPYTDAQAVVPNFGDAPMARTVPEGYSPWRAAK